MQGTLTIGNTDGPPVRPDYSGDTSFAASAVPPSGHYSGGFYTIAVLLFESPHPHSNGSCI